MYKNERSYLAEGVPALRNKWLIQFAHANGAIVFFQDVINGDLNFLTRLLLQLRDMH
jgi:hypothetical protein